MDADLDTLATTLYVRIDDLLIAHPEMRTVYPPGSKRPQMSDAELITLAVMGQLFQLGSERRLLRYAHRHWAGYFPHIPQQSGYNKRLRRLAGLMLWVQRRLAEDTDQWHDDVWLADSTPVEAGRSRETVHRSDLAGFAQYGYCASHSRWFWGFRLHLLCTPGGLPVGFALTGAKADERDVLLAVVDGQLARPGQTIMADKGYTSGPFEATLASAGVTLIRPARKDESPRPGAAFLKPLRQVIESINQTLKGQLLLERHGGRTPAGVITRLVQKILSLTAVIWHNEHISAPIARSLIAYDH